MHWWCLLHRLHLQRLPRSLWKHPSLKQRPPHPKFLPCLWHLWHPKFLSKALKFLRRRLFLWRMVLVWTSECCSGDKLAQCDTLERQMLEWGNLGEFTHGWCHEQMEQIDFFCDVNIFECLRNGLEWRWMRRSGHTMAACLVFGTSHVQTGMGFLHKNLNFKLLKLPLSCPWAALTCPQLGLAAASMPPVSISGRGVRSTNDLLFFDNAYESIDSSCARFQKRAQEQQFSISKETTCPVLYTDDLCCLLWILLHDLFAYLYFLSFWGQDVLIPDLPRLGRKNIWRDVWLQAKVTAIVLLLITLVLGRKQILTACCILLLCWLIFVWVFIFQFIGICFAILSFFYPFFFLLTASYCFFLAIFTASFYLRVLRKPTGWVAFLRTIWISGVGLGGANAQVLRMPSWYTVVGRCIGVRGFGVGSDKILKTSDSDGDVPHVYKRMYYERKNTSMKTSRKWMIPS